MYLLLPIGLTPFIGVFVDLFGHRITLRKSAAPTESKVYIIAWFSFHVRLDVPHIDAAIEALAHCSHICRCICDVCVVSGEFGVF
jgi:hypothetical protein